ncbi:MAG: hypothetical protein A2Z29_11450 [Chloroflexi bacterium RBG_16_56_11]|nr:MAG: hypothetical protein A2Z29_11450 [Chloroflexi bacterium RBG_16_56_11]
MAVINGLEMKNVQKMIDDVRSNPAAFQSTFYAATTWKSGYNCVAEVRDFKVGGTTLSHTRTFKVEGDHPRDFLGTDKGPSAVELLASALGHCIGGGWAAAGALLGIKIESLRIEVEGDLDPQGMLGLPEPGKVRPGYQTFRVTHIVKSKAPREKLEQAQKMSEDLSPVKDSLRAISYSSRLVIQ